MQNRCSIGANRADGIVKSKLISKIERIDKPVNYLRNQVVHRMANLSREDLETEARTYFPSPNPLTALVKEMRALLVEFAEPTKEQCFLYDGINDFVLEALQSKARCYPDVDRREAFRVAS